MEPVEKICCLSQHNVYKLPDIKQLIEKAVSETMADNWRHCVEHNIMKEGDKLWEMAHIPMSLYTVLSIILLTQ